MVPQRASTFPATPTRATSWTLEYALNFLPGLFWKTEYRFSRMDAVTNPIYITATNLPTIYSEDSRKYVHSVRSELVYRFNWGGGAVVAKY